MPGSHPDYAHVYKELLEYTKDGKGKKTPVELTDRRDPRVPDRAGFEPADAVREEGLHRQRGREAERQLAECPARRCWRSRRRTARSSCCAPGWSNCCRRSNHAARSSGSGPSTRSGSSARLTATGLGSREAVFFARLAQGSLGLACQWARLEQDGVGLFETKRDLVAALADYKLADVPEIVDRIQEAAKGIAAGWGNLDKATSKSDLGRRAQRTLIQILISALYDVAIHHVAAAAAAHQRRPGPADCGSGPPSGAGAGHRGRPRRLRDAPLARRQRQ